jgi:Pol polyprotein/gag-pre-integrase-like protein
MSLSPSDLPFLLDSGAGCHISPIKSDFQTLDYIMPQPIKGLGELSIIAVSCGTISLSSPSGSFTLHNAFYIPDSAVQLISVCLLGKDDGLCAFFSPTSCEIVNKCNNVIARGSALTHHNLYKVDNLVILYTIPSSPNLSAHYVSCTLDVETWYHRLSHYGTKTLTNMAHLNCIDGMPIDLSSAQHKCEHCILSKQTHSSVPRIQEGNWAIQPFAHVYVDLCGPVTDRSRCR